MADVKENERILDAGCGVGGSCFFLAKEKNARVTGISLSQKQINYAIQKTQALNHTDLVDFEIKDYSQTQYKASSFDLIWAIESITSAPDKIKFAEIFAVIDALVTSPIGKEGLSQIASMVDKPNQLR